MQFTPQQWVDETLNEFGNPPEIVAEMLESMRGSKVPDQWIEEAAQYNRQKSQ